MTVAAAELTYVDLPWCFDEEDREWRSTVRAFAEQEIAPTAFERSTRSETPWDVFSRLAELGVFGMRVSEEYGGTNAGLTRLCIALEELARVDSSTAATAHTQGVVCALFDHMGTDEQKADLLPRAVEGEIVICFALTEPTGGSDAANMATHAVKQDDGWVLNGAKQFITNAGTPRSRYALAFARTGDGISGFLVPLDAKGVTVAPKYEKLGWRSSDTHPLFFDDVHLPESSLLGEEGRGFREAATFLTWSRLPIAAISTGLAQGCLEETLRFVQNRSSFGKPLSEHQAIAFTIAKMSADVDGARLLTYDGCYRFDHGVPYRQQAAIAKLMASEIANDVAFRATQLHGGYGFVDESAVTRHYRDARLLTIGEGTSEVQRILIARSVGLDV